MEFLINNRKWKILEVSQKEMLEEDEEKNGYYYGKCLIYKQMIYLDKDLPFETKRKTLLHELIHCYLSSYITLNYLNNTSEDIWCDISANSHDIIHEIVEKYFKEVYK